MLQRLHHVAYRCHDARETTRFYTELLGLKLAAAIVQERIPSSGKYLPHNHIFFEMKDGSHIAFFDILGDTTPVTSVDHDWAQHLALKVETDEEADEITERLRAAGVDVLVVAHDNATVKSYYFYDPSGHRLEMSIDNELASSVWADLAKSAPADLERWQGMKDAHLAEA